MADIKDLLSDFESRKTSTSPEAQISKEVEKSKPFIKNDAIHIASEFIGGALADLPRNVATSPETFLAGGPIASQFQSGFNIPTQIGNIFRSKEKDKPLPLPNKGKNLEQFLPAPETKLGEIAGFGANIAGGLIGGPGQAIWRGVDAGADAVSSAVAGPKKVKQIQKAFFDFQKDATTKYGQAIKGARKSADFSKIPNAGQKEIEAIASPIAGLGDDAIKFIPKKARDTVAAMGKSNGSVDDLLLAKQRLRSSLSIGERTGKVTTERSKVVGQVVKNIDQALQKKIPSLKEANKDYRLFSRIREMLEKFEPRFADIPAPFGTDAGEKYLRTVAKFSKEEIEALKVFENASKINIVGPAKVADFAQKAGKMIGKIAGLTATIGVLRASGADRLFFNVADASN